MKKIRYLFLIILIFGIFPSITLSEEMNQDVFINIETQFYPVENINSKIKFIIVNNGNDSFNGSLSNYIEGEAVSWKKMEENLTIPPHNSSIVTRSIRPAYTGNFWIKGTLQDVNGNEITSRDKPLNVHSLEAAAVIGAAIIAVLSLLAFILIRND